MRPSTIKSVKASVFLPVFLFGGILFAQERPQFVWQGEVDGIDILYLRGNKLDVHIQEGAPVERAQFHFYDPLPDMREDARLQVIEGRGYAHIIDQPRLDNQYTLAISIEDRQPGSSFYSLALYWDASTARFERSRASSRTDRLSWSGRVDEEAIVSCHDATLHLDRTAWCPGRRRALQVFPALPHRELDVRIDDRDGRGDIRVLEQPRERNNYTARISIRDPHAGAADYSFKLVWNRDNGKEPSLIAPQRGLVWSGMVDGRVRVTVQGGASFSEVIDGGPIAGEHAELLRPLPPVSDLTHRSASCAAGDKLPSWNLRRRRITTVWFLKLTTRSRGRIITKWKWTGKSPI